MQQQSTGGAFGNNADNRAAIVAPQPASADLF
jgi:hypothetical protein